MKIEDIKNAKQFQDSLLSLEKRIDRLEHYKGRLVLTFEPVKISFDSPEIIADEELIELVWNKQIEKLKGQANMIRNKIAKL